MKSKDCEVLMRKSEGDRKMGSVCKVKAGYFLNYLLPKGLAVPVTPFHLRQRDALIKIQEAEEERARAGSELLKRAIESEVLVIEMKAKPSTGMLYGSVGVLDICAALKKKGIIIENKQGVRLPAAIKQVGSSEITVRLAGAVEAKLKITVQGTDGQQIAQALENAMAESARADADAKKGYKKSSKRKRGQEETALAEDAVVEAAPEHEEQE